MTTEPTSGEEKDRRPAQERVPGATPGTVPGEAPRTEAQDGPADNGVCSSGGGCGVESERDRTSHYSVADRGTRYCRGEGSGWTYLVFDTVTKLHKVGKTVQLDTRLRLLANGTPNELWLIWYIPTNDPYRLECDWVTHWSGKRIFGEWFRLTDDDVRHFKSIRSVKYTEALPGVLVPRKNPLEIAQGKKGGKRRTPIVVGGPIIRRQKEG